MKQDDRTRYNRRDGEEQPKSMGPMGKALLLILLIWACWAIYNFTGDRNNAAEDLAENGIQEPEGRLMDDQYKWRYKDNTNYAGEYYLKEKGLFGKVIKIPMHHEINIVTYSSEGAQVKMRFLYNIKNDLSIEELLYYHNNKELIEQKLIVALRKTMINYGVLELFEGNAAEEIKRTAYKYGEKNDLDIIFANFTPEAKVQEAIQRRADARARAELERQKTIQIKAEAEKQILIERAKQNMEEAVRRAEDAKRAKLKHDQELRQHVIDSMNNVLLNKVKS